MSGLWVSTELMSDLATTLQRVLRWKSDEADCIEARAIITPTIGQCSKHNGRHWCIDTCVY